MIASFKRRWLLLSCAGVLLACSVFDVEHVSYREVNVPDEGSIFFTYEKPRSYLIEARGLNGGHFRSFEGVVTGDKPHSGWRFAVHRPQTGGRPERSVTVSNIGVQWRTAIPKQHQRVALPLWIPLASVLGWIVIRELRWRETARAPALPSDAGGETRRSRGLAGDNHAEAAAAIAP